LRFISSNAISDRSSVVTVFLETNHIYNGEYERLRVWGLFRTATLHQHLEIGNLSQVVFTMPSAKDLLQNVMLLRRK
jgi:hypothetical protein